MFKHTCRINIGILVIFWLLSAAAWAFPHECSVTFTYTAGSNVQQVLLTGSFNGWGSTPSTAYEMHDENGDHIWEVTVDLYIGSYLYKFIVDGNWSFDPANDDKVPDGFGSYNSVKHVDCTYPKFDVTSYNVNQQSRQFQATIQMQPTGGGLDASSVIVTLDNQPVSSSAYTINGNTVTLTVTNLTDGIHDIRVEAEDVDNRLVEMCIMKAYINVSTDWNDATLYFAMTDRFSNGDTSNDAPLANVPFQTNYQGGDFRGIINKLDSNYFSDLGVTALWVSWPGDNTDQSGVGTFGDTDQCGLTPNQYGVNWVERLFSAYHGYWPGALYEVEEHFGDMADLKELVDKAHARGIRIMLDLVINHVHVSSPYYTGSPNYFFHTPIEICQDINWERPITCWFTYDLPDLNYSDPRVIRDILNFSVWWAKQAGCDGFRVDALKHVEWDFIRGLRNRMRVEMEETGVSFYMVGETFDGSPDGIKIFLGNDLVHGQFDFPLNLQILKSLAWSDTNLQDMHNNGRNYYNTYHGTYNAAIMSSFIGNHDLARFLSAASGSLYCGVWDNLSHTSQGWRHPPEPPSSYSGYQKLQLAFTYIMTIPGIPLIYYGDEIGLPGAGDPDNRRMMKFTSLSSNESNTLNFMRTLGTVRKNHPALRMNSWPQNLNSDGDFLVYSRLHTQEKALVAINRSDQTKQQNISVSGTGLSNGDVLTELLVGGTVTVSNNSVSLNVPAKSARIYSNQSNPPPPSTPTRTPTPTATSIYTRTPGPSATPTSIFTASPSPTPANTIIPGSVVLSIDTNQRYYTAGDTFQLAVTIDNSSNQFTADMYIVLEAYGEYYFWPSWMTDIDFRTKIIMGFWTHELLILDFVWPDLNYSDDNLVFHAALLGFQSTELIAYDTTEFGFN